MGLPNLISHADTVDMPAPPVLWREIRSNARDKLLNNSQDKVVSVDCTAGGTIVLSINEREENMLIRLTGTPGAAFTVQFADGRKQMEIENVSGQSATIETATGAASPPVVATAKTAQIQIRGTDITLIAIVGLQSGAMVHSGQVSPTASINFADQELKKALLRDLAFTITSPSSVSGTLTLNMELGNYFDVTLDENVTTLTLSNSPATGKSGTVVLIARQDGTGGRAITWPASFIWETDTGGSPAQTTAANKVDVYVFTSLDAGTTWYGIVLGLDMS